MCDRVFRFDIVDDIEHLLGGAKVGGDSLKMPWTFEENQLSGAEIGLALFRRIASIRSQSASRITWHAHEEFEVLLLLDGSTSYEFADGSTVELSGGHFMVIPPGVVHRGHHDVRRPVSLTGMMFAPRAKRASRNTPFDASDLKWLEARFLASPSHARRMSSELRGLAESLANRFPNFDLSNRFEVLSCRLTVCGVLYEAAKQLASVRIFEPQELVQSTIIFMRSHIDQTVSIEKLAEMVRCSRAKLFAAFRDSTGMTPVDYWTRLRVDHAQEMLIDTDHSITEVAMRCGFCTSQYFSTVFRKYAGVTPTEFRQARGHAAPP